MTSHHVVLYTRQDCHLCEDALGVLQQAGLNPQIVDVDSNESLRRQYDQCVPVVLIDGKERFRGRVDRVLLRRLIERGS